MSTKVLHKGRKYKERAVIIMKGSQADFLDNNFNQIEMEHDRRGSFHTMILRSPQPAQKLEQFPTEQQQQYEEDFHMILRSPTSGATPKNFKKTPSSKSKKTSSKKSTKKSSKKNTIPEDEIYHSCMSMYDYLCI